MRKQEWGMLLALSILWGGSFFFMKWATTEVPTYSIVLVRVALAALTLRLVIGVSGIAIPRDIGLWRSFFTMGLINNVIPFSLLVWGMTEIASGLAAILNATTPMFTILVAHLLTHDERISPSKLVGIFLGFFGVVVLIGFDALSGLDSAVLAMLACLGAAVSYALAAVYGRRFSQQGISPEISAYGQVTGSTIILLPLVLAIDSPWQLPLPGLSTWLSLLALGVLSTGLAYMLYFRILAAAGATNIALVTLLVPVSALLLGWGILDESLSLTQLFGMLLIGLGLLAIDGRLLRLGRT